VEIKWSPLFKMANITAEIIPIPEAATAAFSPPSRAAIFSSRAVVVGFPRRV
jgi:hypothetical protein